MMSDYSFFKQTPELEACFRSLPKSVQEGIMQSGVDFRTADQLREFARHLMEQGH